ncbi:MAG: PAS domain S-box protein [Hyphomonas sp.]|uniref:sensor histidine kinase n=1 Tax=Hyphomonas sp. TaxID=87 RepID=UPI003528C1EC
MTSAAQNSPAGLEASQAEALRESEARFRSTFENAAVGMAHVGPDGRWLRVNRKVSEILGYTPEELLKTTFQDVTHPDDLDNDLEFLAATLRGERDTYRIHKRYIRKGGAIVWANLTVGCVRKESGEVDYFISVIEDISEQTRMNEALAASEARFRAVQQTTPDGFLIFQSIRNTSGQIEDFRVEFANPAAVRMFHQAPHELLGSTMRGQLPATVDAGIFRIYADIVETGEPWQGEYMYPGRNGEEWYRVAAAKLDDGFAVSFADVTKRKVDEERLRKSDEHLRSILDNVMAFVGLLSPDGIMHECNETALASAGLTLDDVVGKLFWETYWFSHDPALQDAIRTAFFRAAGGERVRRDITIRAAEGRNITVDVQFAPTFDERGNVVNIIPSAVDISDRKRAEEHREMLLRELSHRVKNTLATIQTIASHTLREADDMDSFREAFVGRLMAISKSHDLLVESTRRDADLTQLVRDQVMPYAQIGSAQVSLSGPPLELGAEAAHSFGLVLHELATNAAKYGALSTGEGRLEISWSRATDRGRPEAIVEWRESRGPAVSPPTRRGFGSILIEQSLTYSMDGQVEIEYRPEGLWARFRFPRHNR